MNCLARSKCKSFCSIFIVVWVVCLPVTGAQPAQAQSPPVIDPTGRSGQSPSLLKEEPRLTPGPSLVLPPITPAPSKPAGTSLFERVFVRKIQVVGGTVFSSEELQKLTAPYENRELSFEDLEAVRVLITRSYVNRGYVNSGAVIPDQNVTDAVVTLAIIEGELNRIDLEGNKWFRDGYLRDRLQLGVGKPFNVNTFQEQMQLLLQDQRIERLNANLRPGLKLGESTLDVRVEERSPFKLKFEYNNFQSPTVGAHRGLVTFEHQNVFGFGDSFRSEYGGSQGIHPQLDIRYMIPLTAVDTTLSGNYRKNSSNVIEAPFKPLEIENRSEIFGITVRHPLYRSLTQEIAIEFTGERLENKTFLLGNPFSFTPGVENGKSVVSALRFAQEWIGRSATQVLAARSRFSFGIAALGATTHSHGLPDGKFFSWLGQFQWARRLGFLGVETLFRTDVQVANDSLFPLEQIAVGGRYSVRGYRENTLVRDNAALSSLEIRVPLVSGQSWADYIQIAPFVDVGYAWNRKLVTPEPRTLRSVGVGIRWGATFNLPIPVHPQFEIYWGRPLKKVETQGGNLQDHGLHLQFVLALP